MTLGYPAFLYARTNYERVGYGATACQSPETVNAMSPKEIAQLATSKKNCSNLKFVDQPMMLPGCSRTNSSSSVVQDTFQQEPGHQLAPAGGAGSGCPHID